MNSRRLRFLAAMVVLIWAGAGAWSLKAGDDDEGSVDQTDAAPHMECKIFAFTNVTPTRWSSPQEIASTRLMGGIPGRPAALRAARDEEDADQDGDTSELAPTLMSRSANVDYEFGSLTVQLRRGLGGEDDERTSSGDWQSQVVLSGSSGVDVYNYGTTTHNGPCPRDDSPAIEARIPSEPIVDDRSQPRDYDVCVRMVQKRPPRGQEPQEGYLRVSCRQPHNPDRERERAMLSGGGGGGGGSSSSSDAQPGK